MNKSYTVGIVCVFVGGCGSSNNGSLETVCGAVLAQNCSKTNYKTVAECVDGISVMNCRQVEDCIACEGKYPVVSCSNEGQDEFPNCPVCRLDMCVAR